LDENGGPKVGGAPGGSPKEVPETVDELVDVEVHEQALSQIQQPEVRQHLCLMDRLQAFDALQFDEQRVLDDEVRPVGATQAHAFVKDWNRDIALESDAVQLELMGQAGVIRRLEETGADRSMYLDRAADDLLD
jgi:hypothetical protein